MGGRALGRPALPLQPGAQPNGAQPAPPHQLHSLDSTSPNHVLRPQLTDKRNHPSWTPLVPIRQTEPTTRTPFVHPSTAPPLPNPVVVRSVPRSIAYTKHDTQHSRDRVFSQKPEISKVTNPTPERLKTVRRNSTPPLSSAPRTARTVVSEEATQSVFRQDGRPATKNFVSPSKGHALIPEEKKYGPVQPYPH